MSALGKGRIPSCSRKAYLGVLLAAGVVLFVTAVPAHANGMALFAQVATTIVLAAPLALVLVTAIEAAVLNHFLKLGYLRCFNYSIVANLVSLLLGLVVVVAFMVSPRHGWYSLLYLVSFVMALLAEGVVIVLVVGDQREYKAKVRAVVAANALSYAIGAPLAYALYLFAFRGGWR